MTPRTAPSYHFGYRRQPRRVEAAVEGADGPAPICRFKRILVGFAVTLGVGAVPMFVLGDEIAQLSDRLTGPIPHWPMTTDGVIGRPTGGPGWQPLKPARVLKAPCSPVAEAA